MADCRVSLSVGVKYIVVLIVSLAFANSQTLARQRFILSRRAVFVNETWVLSGCEAVLGE
jgi:hypothetical protein